jgi:hypothetical protein
LAETRAKTVYITNRGIVQVQEKPQLAPVSMVSDLGGLALSRIPQLEMKKHM